MRLVEGTVAFRQCLVEFGDVVQNFYHEDGVECFVFEGDFSCVCLNDVDPVGLES